MTELRTMHSYIVCYIGYIVSDRGYIVGVVLFLEEYLGETARVTGSESLCCRSSARARSAVKPLRCPAPRLSTELTELSSAFSLIPLPLSTPARAKLAQEKADGMVLIGVT